MQEENEVIHISSSDDLPQNNQETSESKPSESHTETTVLIAQITTRKPGSEEYGSQNRVDARTDVIELDGDRLPFHYAYFKRKKNRWYKKDNPKPIRRITNHRNVDFFYFGNLEIKSYPPEPLDAADRFSHSCFRNLACGFAVSITTLLICLWTGLTIFLLYDWIRCEAEGKCFLTSTEEPIYLVPLSIIWLIGISVTFFVSIISLIYCCYWLRYIGTSWEDHEQVYTAKDTCAYMFLDKNSPDYGQIDENGVYTGKKELQWMINSPNIHTIMKESSILLCDILRNDDLGLIDYDLAVVIFGKIWKKAEYRSNIKMNWDLSCNKVDTFMGRMGFRV